MQSLETKSSRARLRDRDTKNGSRNASRDSVTDKSKCIQIQVHFHFALTLNAIALRWPTCVSRATCGSLPSSIRLLRNYIPEDVTTDTPGLTQF